MSCQLAATPEFPWTMVMFSDSHGPLWLFDAQRDAGKMPTLPCLQTQEAFAYYILSLAADSSRRHNQR